MCVKFDIKILLFFVIFYMTNQLEIYLLLMIFIFFHELCHLLIGVLLGAKATDMEIKAVGCSISFNYKIEDYNKKILKGNVIELKKILIYISGPLFNICVALGLLFSNINGKYINDIIYINFLIAIFNLIGLYPLDGGRIIKSIAYILVGEKKAYILTEKISKIFLIIVMVFSSIFILKIHNYWIIFYVLYMMYMRMRYSKLIRLKMRIIDIIN